MSRKMLAASCPISARRVDANMVRIISLQVALFTMLFLYTNALSFALVLLFDFAVRTLRYAKLSPFNFVAHFILSTWGVAPKLCDESPKRFALYLGLIISFILVLLLSAGLSMLATTLATILLVCALFETLFDFCIGCKIYYAIELAKGFLSDDRNFK
ncbi:MAG: Unknown protein [uncultured Sulfurovum sp.]|uniref:DUF4395 domain-containing protein n=1 Tax=uncultured Sulfurovum sp. TaxID=269237 RepID=A0A6S6UA50_9BACT|nr:MAG: Unknown protein [uncultured Sulfurovum sp.]